MPKCAWILIGALVVLLNHTIGAEATAELPFRFAGWILNTPAALVMIASLAGFHLLNHHPRRARR